MTSENIFSAMREIDAQFILDAAPASVSEISAHNEKKTTKNTWKKLAVIAACAAFIVAVCVCVPFISNVTGPEDPAVYVTDETESNETENNETENNEPLQTQNENTEKESVSSEMSDMNTQIARPENDYVRFNGELVDLANATVNIVSNVDRAALNTLERLEGLYGDPSPDSYILKITVIDYPESVRILYDTGRLWPCTSVPCRIDSIIYKGEDIDLRQGQNIDMIADYSFDEKEGESQLFIELGAQMLRKGYSYIVYGSYTQPSSGDIYYIDNYDGCFEISSDSEKNAFAENIGLNYSLKSSFQDDVFEKYSYVLNDAERAKVQKGKE